ncbi:class I SAM-dependent methyltransferase [Corynebacterium aquilae]|uniref:Methyltransferase domain-containing protein n=1 Tax=Corynebacterium aquilae DSM 44791 TaxID=1431546 RepID=A0A1L7CGM9_9CORY|nr:methyltransferase domain-containing protein [Corynebacterium aquilae]APT85020.1 hypothetical protein CAQU_07960 [Corynebacterium aquilae DSM 44791]
MSPNQLPGSGRAPAHTPGHWLLAQLGKKVLRPGGKETTTWLLDHADIAGKNVVEFAPGLGVTAQDILSRLPKSYIGIDRDADAAAHAATRLAGRGEVRVGHADATGLPDDSCDIVVGEAMLSMHTDKLKRDILREAARILTPGGILVSHELLLTPNTLAEEYKTHIRHDLARAIHVNARPLTVHEWSTLAADAGLTMRDHYQTDMALLEPRRLIADEGLGVVTIAKNLVTKPAARSQVLAMRAAFRRHREHLGAIGAIYVK